MTRINEVGRDRPESSFEISTELKVGKWLGIITDFTWSFEKNKDKYGYDLIASKYEQIGDNHTFHQVGFVEVEVSDTWVDAWPVRWSGYQFLRRKVHKFDWRAKEWRGLKDDAENAVYVIMNKQMTDAFCIVPSEAETGQERRINGFDTYHADVFRFQMDSDKVTRGKESVGKFVGDFLENKSRDFVCSAKPPSQSEFVFESNIE